MSIYLVTGAAGFIGSNIVEELVARGENVRALDNLSTGKMSNLAPFMSRIDFIEGSLLDSDLLSTVVSGVDYILHQAALPSVPRSVSDPLKSHEANATGTLKLLIAARDNGRVKRIVYASSSSVYGDSPTLPKREDMPTNPLSPYAVNKLAAEQYCRVFTRVYGLPTVALRYFNVFGPRQDPNSQYAAVIPAFTASVLAGNRPTIYGDGTQSRDFTFVKNVVLANLLACETDAADGEAVNIACGERTSLLDLMTGINGILGANVEPQFQEARTGDVKHSLADIGKATRLLGYKPFVSFRDGLAATVRALQDERS
ncbi:MAG TPA: SDR family oxidoreductase [Chloroflexia bacterium]|nr:SDR family oxidoreductase [Chloroflexia bacterium]